MKRAAVFALALAAAVMQPAWGLERAGPVKLVDSLAKDASVSAMQVAAARDGSFSLAFALNLDADVLTEEIGWRGYSAKRKPLGVVRSAALAAGASTPVLAGLLPFEGGGAIVAYAKSAGGSMRLFAQTMAAGTLAGAAVVVDTAPAPVLAGDAAKLPDGRGVLLWTTYPATGATSAGKLVEADGTVAESELPFSLKDGRLGQAVPLRSGFALTYARDEGSGKTAHVAVRYDRDGARKGRVIDLIKPRETAKIGPFRLIGVGDGFVLFEARPRRDGKADLFASRFGATGRPIGRARRIATGVDPLRPAALGLADGTLVVAVQRQLRATAEVEYRHLRADLTRASRPVKVRAKDLSVYDIEAAGNLLIAAEVQGRRIQFRSLRQ